MAVVQGSSGTRASMGKAMAWSFEALAAFHRFAST